MTIFINDSQHHDNLPLYHYAECRILFIITLSFIMSSVVMLNDVTLSVVRLMVMALKCYFQDVEKYIAKNVNQES
jgi:hypothetical protein